MIQNQQMMGELITRLMNERAGQSTPHSPRLPDINKFSGDRSKYSEFMVQLQNFFNGQLSVYDTDQKKISYIVNRLEGVAFKWIEPVVLASMTEYQPLLNSLTQFMAAFSLTFKDPHEQRKATSKLLDLRQGSGSVLDYTTSFTTLLYRSSIDKQSAVPIFEKGLSSEIKARMADKEYSAEFDVFVSEVLALDNRLSMSARPSGARPVAFAPLPVAPSLSSTAPMMVDAIDIRKLPRDQQRSHCFVNNLCFYCKAPGHRLSNCPTLATKTANKAPGSQYPVVDVFSGCERRDGVPHSSCRPARGAGVGTAREVFKTDPVEPYSSPLVVAPLNIDVSTVANLPGLASPPHDENHIVSDTDTASVDLSGSERRVAALDSPCLPARGAGTVPPREVFPEHTDTGLVSSPRSTVLSTVSCLPSSGSFTFPARLHDSEIRVLVDSGATGFAFISTTLVTKLGLSLVEKSTPTPVFTADGGPLGSGRITHEVQDVALEIDGTVSRIALDVIVTPHADIILGLLWLQRVNPIVDWQLGTLTLPPLGGNSCHWHQLEDVEPVTAHQILEEGCVAAFLCGLSSHQSGH